MRIFRVPLATSPPDQYVEIVSRNSGKCFDVYGASTDAAAPAIQYTPHNGANRQWTLCAVQSTVAPTTSLSER